MFETRKKVYAHAHASNPVQHVIRTGNLWHVFSGKGYHTTHVGGTYVNGVLVGDCVLTGGR